MTRLFSKAVSAILSFSIMACAIISTPVNANATVFSQKKTLASFRLIDKATSRPGENESAASYKKIGYGYIHPIKGYGDIKSDIISTPSGLNKISLKEYETIEWYSISKNLLSWKVDGQIVNKPQGTKINAQFRIIKDGVALSPDGTFAKEGDYSVAGTGTIRLSDVYGSDAYKSIIAAPDCSAYISGNDKIYWYNIDEDENNWIVEGTIIKAPVINSSDNTVSSIGSAATKEILGKNISSLDLKEGTEITTSGYNKSNDGGQATYKISSEMSDYSITLDNGLYANLIINNDTINVLAAGIENDGKTDVSAKLNKILNSGVSNIYFPQGKYRCVYRLEINNIDGLNIYGDGSKSIIMTDSDYIGCDGVNENFITIWESNNISFSNITIKALEEWTVSYQRQVGVYYAQNISFNNCSFIVPKTVKAVGPNTDREYTNLAFYTGWKNVTVTNCYFEQLGGVERGSNIILTDIWNGGCENALIKNNTFYHNAHDEMFSLFGGRQDSSCMKNIDIKDNEFYAMYSEDVTSRTMCFTFAYTDSKNVENISFTNNYIEAVTPGSLMTFGNIKNCNVANNKINITNNSDYNNGIVFSGTPGVNVNNNDITIDGTKEKGMAIVSAGNMVFDKNTVTINTSMRYIFTEGTITNNTITLNGVAEAVSQAPYKMTGNKITMNTCIDNFISYNQVNLSYESTVSNNEFNYNYDDHNDAVSYLTGNAVYVNIGTHLNNHTVSFTDNTVKADNINPFRKYLLAYSVMDKDAQKFIITNNKSNVFTGYVYLCQGTQADVIS